MSEIRRKSGPSTPPMPLPNGSGNGFLSAIKNFARYFGLAPLPEKTVARLREDPNFKYCFSYVKTEAAMIMSRQSEEGAKIRSRMLELLRDPDQMTQKDLCAGLFAYFNNFEGYMPGGMHRFLYESSPKLWPGKKQYIDLVDKILADEHLLEKAVELKQKAAEETPGYKSDSGKIILAEIKTPCFDWQIKYYKLCLKVFEIMVKNYQVDPKILWR